MVRGAYSMIFKKMLAKHLEDCLYQQDRTDQMNFVNGYTILSGGVRTIKAMLLIYR